MVRIMLTPRQRASAKVKDLRTKIRVAMVEQEKNQSYMADRLGITQQGFSYNLAHMSFDAMQLYVIAEELDISIGGRDK